MAQFLTGKKYFDKYFGVKNSGNINEVIAIYTIPQNPQRIYVKTEFGYKGNTKWMIEDVSKREIADNGEDLGLTYEESRRIYMDYIMGRREPFFKGDVLYFYWNEPLFGPYIKITFKEVKNEI